MFTMKDNQKIAFTVTAGPDGKGDATSDLGGTPAFTIDDPKVGVLQVSADGLTGTVLANNPGTTTVRVTVGTETGSADITVVGGPATSITLVAGTVADQTSDDQAAVIAANTPPAAPAGGGTV